jgi:hypothetical protein
MARLFGKERGTWNLPWNMNGIKLHEKCLVGKFVREW